MSFIKRPKLLQNLHNKLAGRLHAQAILKNSGWLLGDRLLRMAVGVFINIWIARYFGPEQFGLWSYCISFAGLFVVFSNLGLDTIIVRDLIRFPEKEAVILGTAFWLKLLAGILTFLLTLFAIWITNDKKNITIVLVGLYSGAYIFQSLNVIDHYFQSKVMSKYTVISSGTAFIISTLIKIVLLLKNASLTAIATVGLVETIFTMCFLVIAYRFNHRQIRLWTYQYKVAKELLRNSWPMILSGVSIMIFLRIDQIMIGNILGDREVGIFVTSARMSELSFFLPMVIITSATASIIQAKNQGDLYLLRLEKLLNLTTFLALIIAIIISFTSELIINTLFGLDYSQAAPLLSIHVWSGLFSCIGAVSGIWMTSEGLQKQIFYRTFYGMLANVILNFWWIPIYGVKGAALATICSQIIMYYISDLFTIKTRPIFVMKTRALLMQNNLFKAIR